MSEELKKLGLELQDDIKKIQSSKRSTIVIFTLLVLFVIGYMTFINLKIKEFVDEEFVATIAYGQVQGYINEGVNKAGDYAEQQAPAMLDQALDMAEDKIPEMGAMLEEHIDDGLNTFFADMGEKVAATLEETLDGRDAEIKARFDELLKTEDSRAAMKQVLAEEFSTSYQHLAQDIGGKFKNRLRMLDDELKHLLRDNPDSLSQIDKERRELLICMLAITENFMEKEADGFFQQILDKLEGTFTVASNPAAE